MVVHASGRRSHPAKRWPFSCAKGAIDRRQSEPPAGSFCSLTVSFAGCTSITPGCDGSLNRVAWPFKSMHWTPDVDSAADHNFTWLCRQYSEPRIDG
jgi:hypothetical protein